MLTHPLHQGHADDGVGDRAGEGIGLPGVGLSTARGRGESHQLSEPLTGDQLPDVPAPTVKGRGVFKAGLAAVIPAVTIWKGTKPRPEQLC